MHLPPGLCTSFSQCREEPLAICVVLENGFATVAAAHDMINRTRIFDSHLAGHSGNMMVKANMSILGTDPFTTPLRPSALMTR